MPKNGTSDAPPTESYNALGWRVEAINCCGVVDYVHDAAGNMVGGSATAGPGTSTQYIYFRGGLLAQYWNGDGARFAHINGLGSTQQFTDWTGASAKDTLFYPWGQPGPTGSGAYLGEMWAGFNEGNFWATSEWQTDTRRYTPGLGRWYTPDPAGKGAVHPDDPQTWNMYAYVRNDPTTLTDPSGQCDWCQRLINWATGNGLVTDSELPGSRQGSAENPALPLSLPPPPPHVEYNQSNGDTSVKIGSLAVLPLGTGYAGHGDGLNNPAYEGVEENYAHPDKSNAGPLPRGKYAMGPMGTHVTSNGHVLQMSMRLTEVPGATDQVDRSGGYFMHGGNFHTMDSSQGCIVEPPDVRATIGSSGINDLEVVK